MLPRFQKISHRDFNMIYQGGKKSSTHSFRVVCLLSNKDFSSYAVVIPKKVIKGAFTRNKQKRRIYRILKNFDDQTKGVQRYSMIFIAHKDISQVSIDDLKREIIHFFQ